MDQGTVPDVQDIGPLESPCPNPAAGPWPRSTAAIAYGRRHTMTLTTSPKPVPLSRRAFVQAGAATALSAASYARVIGANDRVGVGFIGFGLIGKRHVLDFTAQPDVAPVAVAEVYQPRLDEATATIGGTVRGAGDFRRLL